MVIQLHHVSFGYPAQAPLFTDFSLTLPATGTVVITGPSGHGKTTLLRLIAGLTIPQQGQILGTAHTKFSWVFQEDRLLPWATVLQNVRLAGDEPRANAALAALGLTPAANAFPATLSGGMARRVAIARALVYGGEAVLLDEAFTGLDAANKCLAANCLAARFPLRILVSHDPDDGALFAAADHPVVWIKMDFRGEKDYTDHNRDYNINKG